MHFAQALKRAKTLRMRAKRGFEMPFLIAFLIVVYVASVAGIVFLAKTKGKSGILALVLCLAVSPLGALAIVLLLPEESRGRASAKRMDLSGVSPIGDITAGVKIDEKKCESCRTVVSSDIFELLRNFNFARASAENAFCRPLACKRQDLLRNLWSFARGLFKCPKCGGESFA